MISYPTPKINIGLDVLRKRPDGFHDLESLFVPYDGMSDVLEIEEASKFSIEIVRDGRIMDGSSAGDWDPRSDLTVKAFQLLRKDFDLPQVRITLQKRIPVGAGLGGGSADASFALRMLSEMFDLYLPDVMLEIYAAQLGSDCPFFIYNRPMFVSGRGDVLEPFDIPTLSDYEIRVSVPEGEGVSTKEAYSGIVPAYPSESLRTLLQRPIQQWRECIKNDFETSVFASHPKIAALKQSFYDSGAVYASMSGSGSSVFGLFEKSCGN